MAHEKMYAICENKCLVPINDLMELTAPKAGWSATAPYQQTIDMPGISSHFNPSYMPRILDTTTPANEKEIKKQCGYISVFETLDGQVKLTCVSKKPTIDLPLFVKVV